MASSALPKTLANILLEKKMLSFGGPDWRLPAWAELRLSSLLPCHMTGGRLECSEMFHHPDELVLGSWVGGFILTLSPPGLKATLVVPKSSATTSVKVCLDHTLLAS